MEQKAKYCINGRFLTRQTTGVDRYAREIVRELDGLLGKGEATLLLPEGCNPIDLEPLTNIETCYFGKHKGQVWEQLDLARYIKENDLLVLNFCNTAPLFNPGIVTIHDMSIRANPSFFGWKFRMWYRFMFWFIMKSSPLVLTDTEFSRAEIEKYYPAAKGKVAVVPCAWQHIDRVEADSSTLEKHGLVAGQYYFAMSSLAPNKNLKWIVQTAKLNPDSIFAVAGGINSRVFGEHDIPEAENVKYLGYVNDSEAKALMTGCKAFLYPTFYEGFGIPPMEAMASGASAVIVSDNPCMHEVYGDSVTYVDPYKPHADLDTCLTATPSIPVDDILACYSWHQNTEQLLDILQHESERQ